MLVEVSTLVVLFNVTPVLKETAPPAVNVPWKEVKPAPVCVMAPPDATPPHNFNRPALFMRRGPPPVVVVTRPEKVN